MARQTKRRLSDLYVVGKHVEFDDGEGESITVYVRKLNAGEHERALRRANAERSKILACRQQPDTEEYNNQRAVVNQFTRDDMIGYLAEDERQRRGLAVHAELAAEEEWAKDDYLQGLQDAWDDGLSAAEEGDEEAARVKAELDRFDTAGNKILDGIVESAKADLEDTPDDVLRERVFDKLLDVQGSLAWLNEFRACEIWLSVREEDRRTAYFTDREEVGSLPNEVLDKLMTLYREISVDHLEGKSSRQADTSSDSSEPAANKEAEHSSGLTVVRG